MRWLPLVVLVLAAIPMPCAAQQAEQARRLQKTHQESLRLQAEFQECVRAGKLDDAYAISKRCETIERELITGVEKAFPENKDLAVTFRELLASTLAWQADREDDRDELDAARKTRQELLELTIRLRGEGHWEVADARRLLGREDRLRTLDPASRRELAEARAANRRVLALAAEGKWPEALPAAALALQVRERVLGKSDPDCAVSLVNLAGLHDDLGDFTRAEPLYLRGIEIQRRVLGQAHPQYARSVNNLAVAYHRAGDFSRAETYYRESLGITKRVVGDAGPDYAAALTNLAALDRDLGRFGQAAPLAREALEITGRALGEQDPAYATQLVNLGAIYQANEEYARAEPLYRRALEIRRKNPGERHPAYARSLNNLAALTIDLGDPARAEPLFVEARDVWRAVVGERHPEYARSLHNLAGCYQVRGEPGRAEPLLREALQIREDALGEGHPLAALSLEQLALACAAQGRWDEALDDEDRARRSIRRHVRRVLPALSASDQLAFLRNSDEASLNTALALGVGQRDRERAVRLSAGWVLNGKGAVPEALAEQSLLSRLAGDPALARAAQRVQEARARLARAVADAPGPDPKGSRDLVASLGRSELDLSASLDRARGRAATSDPWVELDAVRRELDAGTILVEVARLAVYDFQARAGSGRWLPPRYAAWLIPARGEGDLRLVDLGDSAAIDEAVIAFRKAMAGAGRAIVDRGEAKAEEEVRATLEAISARVLRPIEPALAAARRWIISPDSALWLVPWEALTLADGRYSLEGHAIHYVISGRELVARDGAAPVPRSGLVLADPDFDLAAAPRRDAPAGMTLAATTRDAAGSIPVNWQPLPGTADEAGTILPKVQAFLGAEPAFYAGAGAVEGLVKGARRPRVLLLCTHGYFLPDQPAGRPGRLGESGASVTIDNPLLRCGLVLAGANRREQSSDPNGDDGILTGLEVLSADLRATELVVLSACETGLGTVRNGQGVAGLRQAFHLAGARTVMASLWKVPDDETVDLMGRFWESMAAGRNPTDALRDAQRTVIAARREAGHAAHPLYWAAFTITGRLGLAGSR